MIDKIITVAVMNYPAYVYFDDVCVSLGDVFRVYHVSHASLESSSV